MLLRFAPHNLHPPTAPFSASLLDMHSIGADHIVVFAASGESEVGLWSSPLAGSRI